MDSSKIAIVVGATSGIGKYTTIGLVEQGYNVVAVGRSDQKWKELLEEIQSQSLPGTVEFFKADLTQVKEAIKFGEFFLSKYNRVDILVHSTGTIPAQKEITKENLSASFVVNYLSRFAITNILLDLIKKNKNGARIVNIAAAGNFVGPLDFDNLNCEKSFSVFGNLGTFQLCNDIWTMELARRLKDTNVTAVCLNPGFVDTEIRKELGWMDTAARFVGRYLLWWKFQTPQQGAVTPIWLSTSSELDGISGALFNETKKT